MVEPERKDHSEVTRTELVWPGKRTQFERVALPFQVVETINQSRASREQTPLLGLPPPPLFDGASQAAPWTNKLIWGDNKYVMASLLQGDPSIGLEPLAGKVDLIYIDPPFATGQRFAYPMRVGDAEWVKEASIIEEKAYRDTWGRGLDSYLQWFHEAAAVFRELLGQTGSIYVHMDWHVVHYAKVILDEVFGGDLFHSEIVWKRADSHNDAHTYGAVHDTLLFYSKTDSPTFAPQYVPLSEKTKESWYRHLDPETGRHYNLGNLVSPHPRPNLMYEFKGVKPPANGWRVSRERMEEYDRKGLLVVVGKTEPTLKVKQYLDESRGRQVTDWWDDVSQLRGYATSQEERTGFETQKPEELLERVVKTSSDTGGLVADFFCGSGTTLAVAQKLGRRWIGCDLSRYAIQVTRKRLLDISGCTFQVLNLGKYERKHWQVNILNGKQDDGHQAATDYLRFIVALYHAEATGGYRHLHGQKAGRWVHVGATDAPVTRAEVMDAVGECQANRFGALDVLGWEWEMGLHDTVRDEARRMGVDVRLLYIPREVMDRRAVEAGDVHFYELAFLRTSLVEDSGTVAVKLEDFIIPNPDLVPDDVRTKIKKWSDYIDFWAVDWNYRGDTFHNEWQMYRTRKSPALRLISDPHPYPEAGTYQILVKVIDIFGNDTTQLLEAKVT